MKMRIARRFGVEMVCTKCGKTPAYERWSVNRLLKTIKRKILCGVCGKGLTRTQPKPFREE